MNLGRAERQANGRGKRQNEDQKPDQERDLDPSKPHPEFVRDELRAAGEIAGISGYLSACGMMLDRGTLATETDVIAAHGIPPCVRAQSAPGLEQDHCVRGGRSGRPQPGCIRGEE